MRASGDDRPIDQRIERQFVARGVKRDRLGDGGRRASVEDLGERGETETRGFVDLGVAARDVAEMRLQRGFHVLIRRRGRLSASSVHASEAAEQRQRDSHGGGSPSKALRPRQPEADETIDQEADQRGEQQPRFQFDRRGDGEAARAQRQAGVVGGVSVAPRRAIALTATRDSAAP